MKKQNEAITEFHDRKKEIEKMINENYSLFKILATIGEGAEADDEEIKIIIGKTAMVRLIGEFDEEEKTNAIPCLAELGMISILEECGVFDDEDEEEEEEEEDEDRPRIKVFKTSDEKMFKKLTKMLEDEMKGEKE